MNKTKHTKQDRALIVMLAVALVLLAALIFFLVVINFCVTVNGHLYFKNARELDLRKKELSVSAYQDIQKALPDCRILWSVPFQSGTVSSDTSELTVKKLSDEDVAALEYLPDLAILHGESCTDFAQLAAVRQSHPDCRVLCRVTVQGKTYDQDTEKITPVSYTHLRAHET